MCISIGFYKVVYNRQKAHHYQRSSFSFVCHCFLVQSGFFSDHSVSQDWFYSNRITTESHSKTAVTPVPPSTSNHLMIRITELVKPGTENIWNDLYTTSCHAVQLLSFTQWQFLPARRYASAGNSDRNVSVCPSVCPSVTRRYCVKTKKASGMISSPSGSPKILVFWRQI